MRTKIRKRFQILSGSFLKRKEDVSVKTRPLSCLFEISMNVFLFGCGSFSFGSRSFGCFFGSLGSFFSSFSSFFSSLLFSYSFCLCFVYFLFCIEACFGFSLLGFFLLCLQCGQSALLVVLPGFAFSAASPLCLLFFQASNLASASASPNAPLATPPSRCFFM